MVDQFHKMHGLGNDFVVIDARGAPVEMTQGRARAIADRRNGIGCDQIILLEPSSTATVRMRIFNADGGEVEACGNANRAVALLLGGDATLDTLGGLIQTSVHNDHAVVTLQKPRFAWDQIPLSYAMDTAPMPVGWEHLEGPSCVNVGNPHAVFFVEDCDAVDLARLGPLIEMDPLFPDRVNVNVASVVGPNHLSLRVWERGSGLTRACGTGACATAVAAIRAGHASSPVRITLPGGDLEITWAPGDPITMSGPATYVYAGETDWNRFG
jgi:diaminopimelate epimerase